MRKRLWGMSALAALPLLLVLSSALPAQRTRTRPGAQPPAPATPPRNDLKITYRTTTSGQPMENTTMLKGARERSEMKLGYGRDIINITQCDLKRTIQISDSAKKYVITPMEGGSTSTASANSNVGMSEPSRRGGVVTYTTTSVDTGERKEMFGFQARHIKKTTRIESSPDACSPMNMKMETDGWYIDFSFGLNCERGAATMQPGAMPRGGCRDTVRFNQQGAARTGYPLQETTTSYGPDGRVAFTSTKEVIELSREPLDAALFDIPAGYTEAQSAQELYGMPSMDAIMSQARKGTPTGTEQGNVTDAATAKASGAIRVGVVPINNRTDHQVSTESLRERLLSEIRENGVEAIPLNSSSPAEAQAEAKAKQCDFVLFTDINGLKISAAKSLGGMLGRATGVGSGGIDKTEAKVGFQLFAVGESSPRLKSSTGAKEEGDEASANLALEQEANQVSAEVKKRRN